MKIRQNLTILFCFLTLLFTHNLFADNASSTSLAQSRPFLTSLMSFFAEPKNLSYTEHEISFFPSRSELPIVGENNRLIYTVSLQDDPTAPLIFISPGLGAFSFSSTPQFMAELAYKAGYSVVTLPSTTHWSFAVAASTTGKVGSLPQDAKDLYKVLTAIKRNLEQNESIHPRQYALLGYSYGGLESTFLAAEDLSQKIFNFSFVIAINPPLNKNLAMTKIDQYLSIGDRLSEERRFSILSYVTGKYIDLSEKDPVSGPITSLEDFASRFQLSEKTISWVIANEFRNRLNDSVSVANKINNTDFTITNSVATYLKDNLYTNIANTKKVSVEQIVEQSEILSALATNNSILINDNRFILFHSTDDFLSFPEGNTALNNLNVEKHIYPTGGHLGSLMYPNVQFDIQKVLEQRKK